MKKGDYTRGFMSDSQIAEAVVQIRTADLSSLHLKNPATNQNFIGSGWWEAAKSCMVESFLRDQANILNLEISTEVNKGWLSENGRYRVTGNKDSVIEFERRRKSAFDSY